MSQDNEYALKYAAFMKSYTSLTHKLVGTKITSSPTPVINSFVKSDNLK